MTYALDHVFVGCAEGAPEAEQLAHDLHPDLPLVLRW
jgi:hypothetical protein